MDRYIDSKTDIKIEIQTNRQTNRLIDIYMCMQIVDGQIDTQKRQKYLWQMDIYLRCKQIYRYAYEAAYDG